VTAPSPRAQRAALAAVLVLLPPLLLWPLPRVGRQALLTSPHGEAAAHVWALWAALREGHPLLFHTRLVSWPEGVDVLLIDPANLPWVALGAPFGPAAAYNAILLGGCLLMGVAGALLARRVGGAPWLGAAAAMACPAFLAGTLRGATEQLAVAWVGIGLALLLEAVGRGGAVRVILAGIAMGISAWAGPYNGLWMGIAGLAVGAGLAVRRDARAWRRALPAGLVAAAVAAPVAWAIVHDFSVMQDPRFGQASTLEPVRRLAFARGGNIGVADLLDPWVPAPLTGTFAEISQTTYLGIVALVAAAVAVGRRRDLWPWLAGAAAAAAVGLGPWLYVGDRLLAVGGHAVPGPAALLHQLPFLGHLAHWYRAAPVGGLLLAACLSTLGVRRWGPLLVAALVADALLLAPFRWPLAATPPPGGALFEGREPGGAVLELPGSTQPDPPEGVWRNAGPLHQVAHGRPIAGTVMLLPASPSLRDAVQAFSALQYGAGLPDRVLLDLQASDVRWLVLRPGYRRTASPALAEALTRCLGDPVAREDDAWLWDLATAPRAGCPRSAGAPGKAPRAPAIR
jgi:hypothetical protein